MTIEDIFYTQLASALAFIVCLFVLYRVLVSQKDAVIELLKEKNSYLTEKINELKERSPDALVEMLTKRISALTDEIERLDKDKDKNQEQIDKKEKELEALQNSLSSVVEEIEILKEKASEYFCQYCGAPLDMREWEWVTGVLGGQEVEADLMHEIFECGLHLREGEEISPCKNKKKHLTK